MSIKSILKNNKMFMNLYSRMIPVYCVWFPRSAVKTLYRQTYQRNINLDAPKDLNEKINWLKLVYKDDPLVIQCADKWAMREYVEKCGYGNLLNEVYCTYSRASEIDWDKLPAKFALKFNKGAGMNIICTNKDSLNEKETINQVRKWFHANTGEQYVELHYRKAKPIVICEKYLEEGALKVPVDYKVHCINGKSIVTMVCTERNKDLKFIFVDNDYQQIDINTQIHGGGTLPPRPVHFDKMIEVAEALAKPFPLVRVDFYDFDGNLYIGEMTFTPQGGYIDYISQEGLDWLGDLLTLPDKDYWKKR